MKKKYSFLFVAVAILAGIIFSCSKPVPEPEPEPEPGPDPDPIVLERFESSVQVTDNWIYDTRPAIAITLHNPNPVAATAQVKIKFSTDKEVAVTTIEKAEEVAAEATKDITVTTEENMEPGFYKAKCYVDGRITANFVFGISPFKIVSAPDKQPDFDAFWETAKEALPNLETNRPVLTKIPSKCSSGADVYLVELQSVPDSEGGDPVLVHGYYVEPTDGKKHPVLMHFFGYDDLKPSGKIDCPSGGSSPYFTEFYLSTRGQMINNRKASNRKDGIEIDFENIYGDWFAYNFGNRDGYYYRGAFMDCVQAVRFMATRPTSDMQNVFAEGSSQGGALSYATAALSDYPLRAIAPCVAFLGDFPDYFKIVQWPGNVAKANKGSMTDEEMYAFLSYFDTKNLATRISCAVLACSGLQDGTCPPHTNIAPFNNLKTTDKEYWFYPNMQHEIPKGWSGKYTTFFKSRVK